MNKLYYILIVGLLIFVACDDFFDEDLKDKSVNLIAPTDGLETSNTSFTFWWDEVEGASKYNLQIVSPNFDVIEKLVLDTNLTANQYNFQLYPGMFQWRVKAMNGSSETPYTTYSLSVDSSLDLSGQDIILLLPISNFASNESSVSFTWEEKPNAEYYTFRIKSGDWATGDDVISPKIVYEAETTQSFEDLSEGEYFWGVRAENSISSSLYSSRSFIIDQTAPQKPTLNSPGQGAETTTNVTFSWTRPDESGSGITDSLYVSTDSTFVVNHEISIESSQTSYSATFDISGTSQKFYWRVRSIDAAENKSDYSVTRRFTVKK
ncbi:MAG TPA: hypothetical protein DCG75_05105 [Bacteroidales bacterium]|nr:hypothetical protein [Bacteroidales bacterium]